MEPNPVSPPLTPIRVHAMSSIDTSPSLSYRQHLRRRTSSFSSNRDRSPVTPNSQNRFSNASQLSDEFNPHGDEDGGGGTGGGLGNLADELDQLDDEDELEESAPEVTVQGECKVDGEEQSRDSGVDVSYANAQAENGRPKDGVTLVRNFSKPFKDGVSPAGDANDGIESEEKFSSDMEELMHSIARMTSYTSTSEDPLIPRTITHLQDLGHQTSLEAAAQRFTTSTNSLTSHLNTQAKSLQAQTQSLIPAFTISPLDPAIIEETIPLVEDLIKVIPQPNMHPVQKLQKLDRETTDVIHTLTQLADTLQMGKQITNSAARHLRITQDMVVDLRRERENTELARHELEKTDWDQKLKSRWCSGQCHDIISGFEDRFNALRGELEAAGA